VLRDTGVTAAQVADIGIASQRETTVVWDRATGVPVAPAIAWQDRRTAGACERLRAGGRLPKPEPGGVKTRCAPYPALI